MNPGHGVARLLGAVLLGLAADPLAPAAPGATPSYDDIDVVLRRHCVDCHARQEPEAGLILESHETLMKGGDSGPVVRPGRSGDSEIVIAVEAGLMREGKRKLMPPGKREKLKPEEIALLKAWVDGGARGPVSTGSAVSRALVVPRVLPRVPPPRAIRAAAYSQALRQIALGRPGEVELVAPDTREVVRRLAPIQGAINALAFSRDGRRLAVAAGEPGRFGEATIWDAAEGRMLRRVEGHLDALHAVGLSPDGATLATGGYDQKVRLWKAETGELRHTLSAHNAGIFALAFRPDGAVLASASADRTVKLWQTDSGKRVETLGQPGNDVLALAWSPDGRRLAAGGADHRIRVWAISESAAETTNPLLTSRFAHEGAILALAWSADGATLVSSADDQTVKVWDATSIAERRTLERQSDLAPAIAFLGDNERMVAGRMDGTWDTYNVATGARGHATVPKPAAAKPSPPAASRLVPGLSHAHPRGITAGRVYAVTLFGTNLAGITNVHASHPSMAPAIKQAGSNHVVIHGVAALDLPRGSHEIWVSGPAGMSGRLKLHGDDIPSVSESVAGEIARLPVAIWGALDRAAETDAFRFEARSNQWLVIELATRSVDSKLQHGAVTLVGPTGVLLASAGGFDGADRLLVHRLPSDGIYEAQVSDRMLNSSPGHFYRLSIGELPVMTGIYPLTVSTNLSSEVTILGHHLTAEARIGGVPAGPPGAELEVVVNARGVRGVKPFKALAVAGARGFEQEPNDRPAQATLLNWPGAMNGRLARAGDVDWFRFEARRGQQLILETAAARLGSPVDTRIEICDREGRPVPRLRLQAVRNTAINFRGVDANNPGMRLDHYEEMELNEYLYLNGDVMRLFRMPQGPDSDMMMYTSGGKRRSYFDTTAVGHSLDETGFIVEPHPLGTPLAPSGLPVFSVNYENDDDPLRRRGADSHLSFVPPADGEYWIRLTDTRGHGGDSFVYGLVVREARPGYRVSVSGTNLTVSPGSGQSFAIAAERLDGFDGEIRIELAGLPPGFSVSTPLVIEAGHDEARGTLFAAADAPAPGPENASGSRLTASADIDGRRVEWNAGGLGRIKLGPAPKLYVTLEADTNTTATSSEPSVSPPVGEPLELIVAPGATISAWLKIRRNGHQDLVTFFAENLPHGVIVADIGLSGVLIPKEESERRIFFSAARWVRPQERLFYLVEQQAGRQTSRPIRLKVPAAGR